MSFVNLTIYFAEPIGEANVPQNVPQETLSQLTEKQMEIFNMIKDNPRVTREEMSFKIEKSLKTVAHELDEMRKFINIEFVGTLSEGLP